MTSLYFARSSKQDSLCMDQFWMMMSKRMDPMHGKVSYRQEV